MYIQNNLLSLFRHIIITIFIISVINIYTTITTITIEEIFKHIHSLVSHIHHAN